MKNMVKAAIYSVTGLMISYGAILTAIYMYFSNVLPVKIQNIKIIGNQVLRYEIYIICAILVMLGATLSGYGLNFLSKKLKTKKRRRH